MDYLLPWRRSARSSVWKGGKKTFPNVSRLISGLAVTESSLSEMQYMKKHPELEMDHAWQALNHSEEVIEKRLQPAFGKHLEGEKIYACIREIAENAVRNPTGLDKVVSKLSTAKADWKVKFTKEPMALHDMIWLLGEFAYVMVRRAKLLYHANELFSFKHWIQATVACNLGIDFCRHVPPWMLRFDISSKLKLHTLYGICLANLGRFFEATRHFNEAQAILSKMPDASPANLAMIMLRRSEALLTECVWIQIVVGSDRGSEVSLAPDHQEISNRLITKCLGENATMRLIDAFPGTDDTWSVSAVEKLFADGDGRRLIAVPARIGECLRKSRAGAGDDNAQAERKLEISIKTLYGSVLDEAVALLDQAETNLSGNSQSSLWWSRLHTLRLRVYGLLPFLEEAACDSLILRKKSADQGIYESFRNAIRIAGNDSFRKLRVVKYFFQADRWLREFDFGVESRGDGPRKPDDGRGKPKVRRGRKDPKSKRYNNPTRMPDAFTEAVKTVHSVMMDDKILSDMMDDKILKKKKVVPDKVNNPLQAAFWELYWRLYDDKDPIFMKKMEEEIKCKKKAKTH